MTIGMLYARALPRPLTWVDTNSHKLPCEAPATICDQLPSGDHYLIWKFLVLCNRETERADYAENGAPFETVSIHLRQYTRNKRYSCIAALTPDLHFVT